MTEVPRDWDDVYAHDKPPPWDIGRPQDAFRELAGVGKLRGRLLDAGCGTGEHSLLAAEAGADVVGIDLSDRAVTSARAKAAARGVQAHFEATDILGFTGGPFDTVIDSGLFHVFDDDNRSRYVAKLHELTSPDARVYLMCFSEQQEGDWGPRCVTQQELRDAFKDVWHIENIEANKFDINPGLPTPIARAWLATIRRI